MIPLIAALSVLAVIAGACGYLYGLCIGFALDKQADHIKHPWFSRMCRPSNPALNIFFSLSAWALLFYGIPKLVFVIFGITDESAFGLSIGAQLVFACLGMFVGERVWPYVA